MLGRDQVRLLGLLLAIVVGVHGCGAGAERLLRPTRSARSDPPDRSPEDPTRAAEFFLRGKDALAAHRYRVSLALFDSAAQAGYTRSPEWHYWLGTAHWAREDAPQAVTAFRRAVESDRADRSPWSLHALMALGEVCSRTDRLLEARDAYRHALRRERRAETREKIRNQLAELELTLGTFDPDAGTEYNDRGDVVGGVGPGRMRTNRNFEIARHTSDPVKEEKYYRLAVDTDPGMFQSYFNLGVALVHQGRHAEAIPWLLRSDSVWTSDTSLNPGGHPKVDARAFAALCFLEIGNVEEADRHSRMALAGDDSNFWANLYAQRVRVAMGDAASAITALNDLLRNVPEQAEVLYTLSLALAATEDREASRRILRDAVAAIPDGHPWMTRLKETWEFSLAGGNVEP